MEYLEFRKILENKNLNLFDAQYRVAHNRLIDSNKLFEINQIGGGHKKNYIKPFFIFKNANKNDTILIINYLLNNKKENFLDMCRYNS